jgi:pimeloyl-ACP methyl ester carboxylesterase
VQIRTGSARSRAGGDIQTKSADAVDIYYEDMGDPNNPAVLLIMGLGAQLLLWRNGFCEKLVDQGLRVIRYDNRDVGLSSKVSGRHTGAPLLPRMVRSFLGMRSPAVYTLEDVADDAAALLDHLKIDTAHIVGASMGGMVAQVFAARHRHRTKTLAIIFSSNNQPLLPPPGPRHLLAILQRPKDATRDAIIDNAVRVSRIIGSPGYPAPAERIRAEAIEAYDRAYYPAGVGRHFAAILGSGSLLRYDRQITAPTLVLHGKADKLMRPFGGRAIARAIKGARLVLFDGMGHELPEPLWDDIVGELKSNFAATG